MSAATPFPSQEQLSHPGPGITFRALFEHFPLPAARCNSRGEIIDINPAFERMFNCVSNHELPLWKLAPEEPGTTQTLLQELLDGTRDSICIRARNTTAGASSLSWTGWRMRGGMGQGDGAVFVAQPTVASVAGPVVVEPVIAEPAIVGPSEKFAGVVIPGERALDEEVIQAQRWAAVGRLAGGVVHDFNNLLTGVMLYCDLLLSSFDVRDRRRRYADEIRAAITQASGLVQQLLVFARPQVAQVRSLCLNEIATSMRNLLVRLIGENIELELRLDPDLALIKIDHAQAQQILLNLVLNARDALPDGGRITIETSNCKFQPVAGAPLGPPVFPCVLLVVGDNGHGMDAKTRQRLFEPFFTTKSSGQGTGLGLTTVRSIVTTNRGLIHLESEAGRGTRAMVLLPRELSTANSESADHSSQNFVHSFQKDSASQGRWQQDSANQNSASTSTQPISGTQKGI